MLVIQAKAKGRCKFCVPACRGPIMTLFSFSRQDRYDLLRICIGEELRLKLANLRLFMVRCPVLKIKRPSL